MSNKEISGHCESCGKPIYEGDLYGPCTDGIMLCEKHTFMLSDAERQMSELVEAAEGDGDMRDPEDIVSDLADIRAEIAANGNRKVLYIA